MFKPEIRHEDPSLSFQPGEVIPAGVSLHALTDTEWHILEETDRVAIRRQGETLQTGTVDGPIENSNVFWVWLDQGKGRVLLHRDDQPRIWRLI